MIDLERRAKVFANWWHLGQLRKYTNTPYIEHPARVAWIVKGVPHTDEMVAAAWLHDVLEDTGATELELRHTFGSAVTDLVIWLTDQPKQEGINRAARKALDRQRLVRAPAQAKTLKLADLIDNSASILKYDANFARVFLLEMRLALDEALSDGDSTLWAKADAIVRSALL